MLSHAHLGNYDAAMLVAGDRDYLPLVEEVKRRGKHLTLAFFAELVHDDLRRAADSFIDLTQVLEDSWKDYWQRVERLDAREAALAAKESAASRRARR